MLKLGWQLLKDKDALWARVLRGKYLNNGDVILDNSKKSGLCRTWKAILAQTLFLLSHVKWSLGNDSIINFQQDNWLLDFGPLSQFFTNPSNISNLNAKVKDYVNEDKWIWDLLRRLLPQEICNHIFELLVPVANAADDHLHWALNISSKFTISSAITCLSNPSHILQEDRELWQLIWNWKVPRILNTVFGQWIMASY